MRQRSSSSGPQPGSDDSTVEVAAVRLLARREHSAGELKRKLLGKGHASERIEPVLQKLARKQLLSDERFTANFVQHHARRGQGPVRIRAQLRQQGIADPQVDEALRCAEVDWSRLAGEVRQRKFGAALPRSLGERAKQSRFLQYRGFDAEQIRAVLRGGPEDAFAADPAPDA